MPLGDKFPIVADHAILGSRRRPGRRIGTVRFLVAHDTANPGASARNHARFYRNDPNPPLDKVSSAHLFVDDREIIETIPAFNDAEEALHVLRSRPRDNELYGVDANRGAIGVEYCYGGNIDPGRAYERYVWLLAALCERHRLDPSRDIVGHHILDPGRKSDPQRGLGTSGRSYERMLLDVLDAFRNGGGAAEEIGKHRIRPGTVATTVNLRCREAPRLSAGTVSVIRPGTQLEISAIVRGDAVNGNDEWCKIDEGFCWSGGVQQLTLAQVSNTVRAAQGFIGEALQIAGQEWRFFGEQTQNAAGRTVKEGHKENESAPFWNRIRDYWVEGTNTHGLDGRNTDSFWSAAFISWIMRKAGAGTRFRYSIRHSHYISQAIRDRLQQRAEAGFWCFRLDEERPAPGDIVCFARESGVTYDNQKGGEYAGHCDLVVDVSGGNAHIIGGNIGNSVTKRPLPLDAAGRLRPATRLFGLMKCRII